MGKFLSGFVLPLFLLTAALVNWSLISLVDLVAFLFVQYSAPKTGFWFQRQSLISWYTLILSSFAILSHAIFHIVWIVKGDQWSISDAQWAKLIGFLRGQSRSFPSVTYFLVVQVLAAFVALFEICLSRFSMNLPRDSFLGHLYSFILRTGSNLRVLCCLLLPAVQLVVGISHPSWVSLPFFVCSSIGLVDWSLTSNFLGLFRSWRYLLLYSGLNIVLLYLYQLPVEFYGIVEWLAGFIGLYKISANSEWSEVCSCLSLVLFYIMLSWIRCDLIEMEFIMSARAGTLTEQLLPTKHSFFILESRSGVRHTNILLRGPILRTFGINFFTYGFPISFLALSFWSFHFASFCALGLIAYFGYVLYVFPTMYHLHRLNGLLLVFILLWAVSTYIFNIAFTTVLNKDNWEDMNIWETIGLWRYPIPGFYLLAQFGLGVLIALVNLVNNSVFLYLADREGPSSLDDSTLDESEETKVLIVATVVWGLRKTSLPMALFLLFLIALNPGFIHALYMVFFLIFLLSHNVDRKTRKCLILLCEAHFTLLYVLQLNLISTAMEKKGSIAGKVLSQLGSFSHANSGDFLKIVVLASFCAIHNHGFEMLLSFSAIVQQTPRPPIGFNILRAGLLKSAILSVYTRSPRLEQEINYSHERKIGSYLNAIGHKFLSMYRSCGTYIVILTILLTLYTVTPNYLSFGYLFFLLLWISGRQVAGKTVNSLWRPLKIYAIVVFVFIYGLSVFSSLQEWLSKKVDLSSAFGFDPEASMLENIWESLAVLIVMQLYSYERRQSIYFRERNDAPEVSACKYLKRLLIWHREKILYLTVFYASLSPISLFGFSYLFALVICSITSKTSDIPSKFFLVYSALLVMVEYPFQMWGSCAELFPGQKHSSVSFFLGLQVYEPGFWGVESGLRGKILVIVASLLRYNVSGWLQKMPCNFENGGWWEDSCAFFMLAENAQNKFTNFTRRRKCLDTNPLLGNKMEERSHSCPSLDTHFFQGTEDMGGGEGKHSSKCLLENSKDNHKWYRKQIHVLRKERLQMQKASLKIYMKFWIENMFSTFGLQINMAALLVASFAVLNAISLLYIASLVACILLSRKVIRKLWPMFVFLFASVFTLEYVTIWLNPTSWKHISPAKPEVLCKDCWRSSDLHYDYCKKCWLGFKVDDPRMLISYYAVFMFSCLKLHADRLSSLSGFQAYKQMISHSKYASGLIDLSFETKVLWTFLDYLRLYIYCHLLDLVLALILITGTLEYDILHLGYLGFALVFFRLRLQILKKKNSIFKFLRIYNFALIVLSLAYQSPFVGDSREGKLEKMDHVSKVIGLRKYKFHFTSRNALVEIVIFMLVALQSFMFSSLEFDYVSKYLEAEKFGALVREQEKRAAWKTAQLQHIRKTEEQKRMRNSQVEKIKAEMLNLQIHLLGRSTSGCAKTLAEGERKRNPSVSSNLAQHSFNTRDIDIMTNDLNLSLDLLYAHDMNDSPTSERTAMESRKQSTNSFSEIPELNDRAISDVALQEKPEAKGNPLKSAAQLIGVGVSQVQSLGNQAVLNLVSLLNIEHEKPDIADEFSDDEIYYEIENQDFGNEHLEQTQSTLSDSDRIMSNVSCLQIRMIFHHIWDQMRSNNDVVCYCCFILIFLWNFSLLSMVYLVALFFYALWVNTGPSNMFWVIILIYTEFCILLQYLYQIIIQNFGMIFEARLLREWGFPARKIMSSFVIGHWPLFLVYLFTLLQSAITARNDESAAATEFRFSTKRTMAARSFGFIQRIKGLLLTVTNGMKLLIKNLYRFWKSLAHGSETPPYFVQLSMEVNLPPEDSIQPETIESKMNKLLKIIHDRRCRDNHNKYPASRVRVQSIERSPENVNVALAVFEVLYTSPSGKSSFTEWKRSLTPAANVTSEILAAYHAGIFREIGFPYMILSVIGGGKKDIDLYAYVFCADLLVFFLVAIFYQSVIKNSSEILEVYQHEDQFPIEFVFILMVIFFLIVLDRIIYLCSFASGKVIFYIFTLVLFTYSVINYAWRMEPSDKHAGKFAIRAIYLTKLISLALQAIQIRFGIPHESNLYRQFLTSTISQTNFLGFRIYRALPFLYELRCVLDWSCTTTSLTMYDWLKLEDIHGSLFLVKCDAELNRAKHPQGQKQTKMTKFCNGICLFFILMCVIWAPMLMYSSGNPTNIANPIREANVRIDIQTSSGRLTLFETTLCEKISWTEVEGHIDHDPRGYLANYNEVDIQLICCQPDASNSWLVPSVVQARFIQSLQWSMDIVFSWKFRRDRPRGKEVVRHQLLVADQDLPTAAEVMQVLNGTSNSFRMLNIYPRYFRVTGSGDFRFLEEAVDLVSGDLVLNPGKPEWWSFYDLGASNVTGCGEFAGPMAIIVSEETPQGILGDTLSKFSIWGLYITFVLAVGRFIRLQCSDLRMRIQFENLPSCNRLLAICEDIYAARAEGELEVEEVLYWTLVSIYRSPHNLLEYTKPE